MFMNICNGYQSSFTNFLFQTWKGMVGLFLRYDYECINEIYQLCQIAPSHIGNLKQKEAMDSYVYELSLSSDRNDT